jgi:hypothetical protein
MKSIALAATIALAAFSGGAIAACTGTPLTQSQLTSVLTNNTVCVAKAGGWDAQEQHITGGVLKDYKQGPTSTIDPTQTIGTWSLTTAPGQVTYVYSGGGTYSYSVYTSGAGYSFCGQATVEATVKSGTAAGC